MISLTQEAYCKVGLFHRAAIKTHHKLRKTSSFTQAIELQIEFPVEKMYVI